MKKWFIPIYGLRFVPDVIEKAQEGDLADGFMMLVHGAYQGIWITSIIIGVIYLLTNVINSIF